MFWKRALLIWLVLAALFLAANRPAYKGHIQDDEIDNLAWTRDAGWDGFAWGLLSPQLQRWNFRPAGHAVFKMLGTTAGLNIGWHLATVHALHLLNVALVIVLLRKMPGFELLETRRQLLAAASGALIFAFHAGVFDAHWKLMYVFDVLCTTFLLVSLILYVSGRWLLALIPFWLAYKSKEIAITLPAVLFTFEYLLGQRRWRRVVPFALISVLFGVQAVMANRGPETDYTLRFSLQSLATCASFYAGKLALVPWVGALALAAAGLLARDRRVWFGVIAVPMFLGPLLFLPGRLFGAYLYLSLTGVAIATAFIAAKANPVWMGLFFLVWVPWNYRELIAQRRVALSHVPEVKAWYQAVERFARGNPETTTVIVDGSPTPYHWWGVEGSFHWFLRVRPLQVLPVESADAKAAMAADRVATVTWDRATKRMFAHVRNELEDDAAYLEMDVRTPPWQLVDGWYPLEAGYRWTKPEARLRLRRPASATAFEMRVNLGPAQLKEAGGAVVELLLNGTSLGTREYKTTGWHEARWPVPPGSTGRVELTIRVLNPFQPAGGDPRTLGVAVVAAGFLPRE